MSNSDKITITVWLLITVIWFIGVIYYAAQKRKKNPDAEIVDEIYCVIGSFFLPHFLIGIILVAGVCFAIAYPIKLLIDFCAFGFESKNNLGNKHE